MIVVRCLVSLGTLYHLFTPLGILSTLNDETSQRSGTVILLYRFVSGHLLGLTPLSRLSGSSGFRRP